MKKVGIIGCGGIARVHGWVLSAMENVKISALCDIDAASAESLAGEYARDATIVTDWRELSGLGLDVVHICTPHMLHASMTKFFLEHDTAVFCEKPCAISCDQFDEIFRADKVHPGKLGFCFQNRYNETTLLMDELIQNENIGKILGARAFVTWRRDPDYYTESTWKGRLETEGGGVLINQSVHTLDLLLRYCGKPDEVKGTIAYHHMPDIEVEDTVEAWLSFPDGKRACFYASNGYACDAPVLIEIQGEHGRVCMNGGEVTLYTEGHEPKHFLCENYRGIGRDYWGCGHRACIGDFYRCLDSGERFQNDLKGVENTFNTMMKIYSEGREKRV